MTPSVCRIYWWHCYQAFCIRNSNRYMPLSSVFLKLVVWLSTPENNTSEAKRSFFFLSTYYIAPVHGAENREKRLQLNSLLGKNQIVTFSNIESQDNQISDFPGTDLIILTCTSFSFSEIKTNIFTEQFSNDGDELQKQVSLINSNGILADDTVHTGYT